MKAMATMTPSIAVVTWDDARRPAALPLGGTRILAYSGAARLSRWPLIARSGRLESVESRR